MLPAIVLVLAAYRPSDPPSVRENRGRDPGETAGLGPFLALYPDAPEEPTVDDPATLSLSIMCR